MRKPMNIDADRLITLDTEVFSNYLLVMFRKISDGKVIYFEKHNDEYLNIPNILKILKEYTIGTFNGIGYDLPILEVAVAGMPNMSIKATSNLIIDEGLRPWQVRKQMGVPAIKCNHIDLLEVAPSAGSLKVYAGRIHARRMMDLPIDPNAIIRKEDLPKLRHYCEIDNENTAGLYKKLIPEIKLRANLSKKYNIDVMSKSDAQIAEAVIKRELKDEYNVEVTRPKFEPGSQFYYKAPDNLKFETPEFQEVYDKYTTEPITLLESGKCQIIFNNKEVETLTKDDYDQYWLDNPRRKKKPFEDWKESQKQKQYSLKVNNTTYSLGIGGIHSCEKSTRHVADDKYMLRDYDVAAFYPEIILNNSLYPEHIGKPFLHIFRSLVERRLASKAKLKTLTKGTSEYEEHTTGNESGKIIINGTFGKLGSKWSFLYSPHLLAQVTITGQLTLLMLIERLHLAGAEVVSANTDGVVVKMLRDQESQIEDIVSQWEFDTSYTMESADYLSLNSRDVNNYVAVKVGDVNGATDYSDSTFKVKGKGDYAPQSDHYYMLRTNPSRGICSEAVKAYLKTGKPIDKTVRECTDITKFLSVRKVNGGAEFDGSYVGKVVRWYYSDESIDAMYYVTSGNKVPKTDGVKPMMELCDNVPDDLDYQWYIDEAYDMLKKLGCKH